jgi:hypothetical protein
VVTPSKIPQAKGREDSVDDSEVVSSFADQRKEKEST